MEFSPAVSAGIAARGKVARIDVLRVAPGGDLIVVADVVQVSLDVSGHPTLSHVQAEQITSNLLCLEFEAIVEYITKHSTFCVYRSLASRT